MAAALKAAAAAAAAARSAASTSAAGGLRRMSSIFSGFNPPPPPNPPPQADPSTNLFVSGLSKRTTTDGLREAFSKFGQIVQARVVTDRISGYSKGFAFVRYTTLEEANAAIEGMHGKFLDGWVIFAEYARPRPPPAASPENLPFSPSYSSQPAYNGYKNVVPGNPQSEPVRNDNYSNPETA
uniref:Nucleolin n=1 Tax=Anthurium amnicola TaxID=1678845 RepID=A0A1D1YVA8_9ARAE